MEDEMPVLQPTLEVNENSIYARRTAPAAAGVNAAPSAAQVSFVTSLLADRDASDADRALQGLIDAFHAQTLTKGNASKLIDALKALPYRTRMADWKPRGFEAPASRQQNIGPVAAARPALVGPGYYRMDGTFYKVQTSRSSGRDYALAWDGEGWDYEAARQAGAMRKLTAEMVLDAEAAKAFGDQYHACIFCSQQLTDQRSIDAGYGPVCADNHALPWG